LIGVNVDHDRVGSEVTLEVVGETTSILAVLSSIANEHDPHVAVAPSAQPTPRSLVSEHWAIDRMKAGRGFADPSVLDTSHESLARPAPFDDDPGRRLGSVMCWLSAGDEGNDDVGSVAVEVLTSPVVDRGRTGIGVPRGAQRIPVS
jgi:hypothetical protein